MRYRLGDICEIVSGSTPKTGVPEYWDGDIKWITPAELSDDSYIVNDSVRHITELGVQKTGLTSFPEGTVLLSSRAPIGKVAIAGCEMYCNQGFKNLICSEKINNRYLFWFLKGNTEFLNSLGRGATFKEISKQIVTGIEINVPDMTAQIEAVKVLEKISGLIKLRRRELQQLDELIKARFMEQFGDFKTNPRGLPITTIDQLFDVGSSKRVFQKDWKDAGVPFYRAREIVKLSEQGYVDNELFITEEMYEDYAAKYGVPSPGDIMVTGVGTLGICYLVKETDRFYYKDGNTLCFHNRGGVNSRFVLECYKMPFIREQIESNAVGSTVGTYTIEKACRTRIFNPPMEEQLRFVAFVEQSDKSKVAVQEALDEAQLLLDSLMQQYFG